MDFDHLIIDTIHADFVCNTIAEMGIDSHNVICLTKLSDGENKFSLALRLLDYLVNPEEIVDIMLNHPSIRNILPMSYDLTEYTLFNDPTTVRNEKLHLVCFPGDYARVRELELLAWEIKNRNLKGAMAEVGVMGGGFSKLLKHLFPEKDLYLYDTFSGFDDRDTADEYKNGAINQTWANVFKSVTYENTKKYIGNEETCHYRVGYFPETVEDEERSLKFSLVSLDADLYNPTLEGLEFFYPRLEEGGYILIHEYNARILDGYAIENGVRELSDFSGIKKAVKEFEKRHGYICKVPITDHNGTIVITK